ncbi:DUF6993 domain-containing protein [Gryllotalpicola reticulitermitis]|uniref:DUF6993 domain-containing protein n=1 Tax=Gryllotalpicola reticulitermitis TaxID=1184153 RepID=UPI0036F379D6
MLAVAVLGFGVALAGCTAAGNDVATPTQSAWTVQPTAGATTGSPDSFVAKGTAAQNQAAFDATIQGVLAKNAKATGQAVTAALESAGLAKSSLQFSASRTSAKLVPGSILVSAQFGSECVIGQWGNAVGGYHSAIAPALGAGGCLVGGGGTGSTPSSGGGSLGD